MKNKIIFAPLLILIVVFSMYAAHTTKPTNAASDTCSGVQTTFNASYPSSVTAGQVFTISSITSQPSNSYGMNILSSTLTMTATNASPANYNKSNLSTNPSPTTGATTYTAYYPSWSLTAGSAGSTITVKLTNASANVSGYGVVNCTLTATLATIPITAPVQSGGTGGSTSGGTKSGSTGTGGSTPTSSTGNSNSTSGTTKTSAGTTTASSSTPGGSTPNQTQTASDQSAASNSQTTSSDNQSAALSVSIVVKDGKNKPLKGAKVTLDNQQSAYTTADGTVTFEGTSAGDHKLSVTYGKQKIDRTISVSQEALNNTISVVIPIKKSLVVAYILAVSGISIAFAAAFIFMRIRHRSSSPTVQSSEMPLSTIEQNQMYSQAFAETAGITMASNPAPQYPVDQNVLQPAQNLNSVAPIQQAPTENPQPISYSPSLYAAPEAPIQPQEPIQPPTFIQMPVATATLPTIAPPDSPTLQTTQAVATMANSSPDLTATQQTTTVVPPANTIPPTQDPYQVPPIAQAPQTPTQTNNQKTSPTQQPTAPSIQNFPSHSTPDNTSV